MEVKADLLLLDGKVITVDSEFNIVEAVAVKDGKIIATGMTPEIEGLKGEGTEVIGLEGKTVLPGLIDSHLHVVSTGMLLSQINCRTPPMSSISDILTAVREVADKAEPGEWILGRGWDQVKLSDHRNPTRWDLDKVSPENPVWLTRTCGHIGVCNSLALEIGGVSKDTPQPVGGNVEKDEGGEPTGLLEEGPAMNLVRKHIPPTSFEDTVKAIKLASRAFSEAGLTLNVRVNMMLHGKLGDETAEESVGRINDFPISTGYGNDLLRFLGLKLLIDGGIGGRTALLREPYEDQEDNKGILIMPTEDLQKRVDAGNLAGMNIGIHCAGGGAMDVVLNAFEETDKKKSIKGRRFSIIHAYQPTDENFETCRRLGIVVASQPSFLYYLGDSYHENVGDERSKWLKPHRAWIDNGIEVSSGTDSPVTPYPPFPSLWASIARRTEVLGTQMGTEQKVTREEAIRMYTIKGAYYTFEENIKGSIEPGKLADMIVLDRDILTCPEDEMKDTQILKTILAGKTVYKA